MKVSVIIPTIGKGRIDDILEGYSEADEVIVLYNNKRQCVDNMNDAGRRVSGDIIVQVNDRCKIKPGWRKKVEKAFNVLKSGVVSFAPDIVTNGAISRDYLNRYQLGCVFFPEYIHHYADKEMGMKSRSLGMYKEILGLIKVFPKKPHIYDQAKILAQMTWDIRTFQRREKLGFPNELTVNLDRRKKYIYVH